MIKSRFNEDGALGLKICICGSSIIIEGIFDDIDDPVEEAIVVRFNPSQVKTLVRATRPQYCQWYKSDQFEIMVVNISRKNPSAFINFPQYDRYMYVSARGLRNSLLRFA